MGDIVRDTVALTKNQYQQSSINFWHYIVHNARDVIFDSPIIEVLVAFMSNIDSDYDTTA